MTDGPSPAVVRGESGKTFSKFDGVGMGVGRTHWEDTVVGVEGSGSSIPTPAS